MADADCLSPNSLGALLGAAPWSRSSQGLGTPILDELGTAFEAREGLGRAPRGGEQRAGDRPKSVTPTPGDALLDELGLDHRDIERLTQSDTDLVRGGFQRVLGQQPPHIPVVVAQQVSGGATLPRNCVSLQPQLVQPVQPHPYARPVAQELGVPLRQQARAAARRRLLRHHPTHKSDPHDHPAQDRLLPLSNLGRIMKRVLPHDAKVSKGSKEAMQETVGEFICFVTSEANDLCKEDPQPGKKTLHGAHITGACANLDLAELVAPIRAAALPTSRGSLPDARAKGKIAKQNSFNDLTSIEAHAMSSLAVAC